MNDENCLIRSEALRVFVSTNSYPFMLNMYVFCQITLVCCLKGTYIAHKPNSLMYTLYGYVQIIPPSTFINTFVTVILKTFVFRFIEIIPDAVGIDCI